jgi:predicted acetyltransferase
MRRMDDNNLDLVESSLSLSRLRNEFFAFADEIGEGDDYIVDGKLLREDFSRYLRMLLDYSNGVGLPANWVPQTTLWYLANGVQLVGSSSIRHRLTPALEEVGGHIGYVVRPCERGKGHGTKLLTLTLKKAHDLGLGRVLLTTDVGNVASRRIIEKNGGILAGERMAASIGTMKARYWIALK